KAVRYSMLVNPTGKRMGWRGVDWVIEHNNLYIKRIYAGKGSNRKKGKMFKESALIEVYKSVRIQFEDMYCLNRKSTRHAPANLSTTFLKLRKHMEKHRDKYFTKVQGRKAAYHVPNAMSIGMKAANSKKMEVVFTDAAGLEWADLPKEIEVDGEDGDLAV
ncbi:hypothetical protein BKA70DRAFT_1127231, partial [Coprinopsis sp. MPI-PUGE-AT-0042]